MSLQIVFLFCKTLFYLSQIHQLRGILWSWRQGLINLLFKLHGLALMLLDQILLDFLGLLLVLGHFLIPIIIELCYLFNMSHLHLFFLILMFWQHLSSLISFNLCSHFCKFLFSQICFDILSCLLTLFLMSIKDLPNFKMENTCINRYLLLSIQEC